MEASTEGTVLTVPNLKTLPNLRLLCGGNLLNSTRSQGLVYRSSRPDHLEKDDLQKFRDIGIRCILDFRSKTEYLKSGGKKELDDDFDLFKTKIPRGRNLRPQEIVTFIPLNKKDGSKVKSPDLTMKDLNRKDSKFKRPHFIVDFLDGGYIWTIFNRAPWYKKLYSLLFLIYDFAFNTGYKHFVRYFCCNLLNYSGLASQYKDFVDLSQRNICAALKFMTDESNYPILLNCAHGKDRTGIVSALVLGCCGMSKEYIIGDYRKSEEGCLAIQGRMRHEIVDKYFMAEDFLTARPETMMELLNYIEEKYGSIKMYLEYIGFGVSEQETLKQILLGGDASTPAGDI